MLAQSPLKAELQAFRAGMKTPQYERAELKLIDDWIDTDCEKEWRQIKKCAPTYPAHELFKAVLCAWQSATVTAARLQAWAAWRQEMKQGFDHALSGPAHKQDPKAIIKLLRHALAETRVRFGDFKYVDEAPERISLSQKEGDKVTRARKLFMQILVNYFVESFGQPFFDMIVTVTEIVLPGPALCLDDVINSIRATTDTGRKAKRRRRR